MFNIMKMNKISDCMDDYLPANNYATTEDLDQANALIVRSKDLQDITLSKELLAIARAGAGTNNIPIDRCTEKGIVVFNTPGANANSVKEMVICGIIMGCRNVAESIDWTKTLKGKGADVPALAEKGKKDFNGNEIFKKKLGVLGLGATGALVAEAALNLGMDVYGFDPYLSVNGAWNLPKGVKHSTKEDILRECDVITMHIPLTKDTKYYIGESELALMKETAVLLNFSRADLVERTSLLKALESKKLHKYVVDFPTDDVVDVPNILCLPHLASCTTESEDNCAIMAAREVVDYLENGNITNSVNYPNISMAHSSGIRLTVNHKNTVGMISKISSILSSNNVNIVNMCSASKGDNAYSIFDLDCVSDIINSIGDLENVCNCRLITY